MKKIITVDIGRNTNFEDLIDHIFVAEPIHYPVMIQHDDRI